MDHSRRLINGSDDKVSLSNGLIKDEISSCDSIDLDREEEKACSVIGENRDLIHSDVVSKVLEDEVIKVLHKDVNDEKHLSSSSSSSCVIDVKENLDGEWVCRICHLDSDQSLEATSTTVQTQRELIQLGCGCKDELGVAHPYCGEAWFKIKGNRLCEICGETATNITGIGDDRFLEEWNDRIASGNGIHTSERSGGCWSGQPFCNFLMACLVIAFVLPWFFRVSMF